VVLGAVRINHSTVVKRPGISQPLVHSRGNPLFTHALPFFCLKNFTVFR